MIEIRQAGMDDGDGIRAISKAVRHPFRAAWFEDHLRKGNCLVAVQDGAIVGYAIFAHTLFLMGFLEMLLVVPEHRRKGIARSLISHAEGLCTTERMFASTNESNKAMHRLLAGLDYVPCGMLDLDPGDPEMFYVKKLK